MRFLPPRLSASLPALVLAVFVLGGIVGPDVHRASHAAEWAAERAAHAATHCDGAGDRADTPCPPAVADLDCALCAGLSLATPTSVATVRPDAHRAMLAPPALVSSAREAAAAVSARGPPAA